MQRHGPEEGLALTKLYKFEEAIKSFDNALEVNPKYAGALNNKRIVLNILSKSNEAVKSSDK